MIDLNINFVSPQAYAQTFSDIDTCELTYMQTCITHTSKPATTQTQATYTHTHTHTHTYAHKHRKTLIYTHRGKSAYGLYTEYLLTFFLECQKQSE